MIVQCIIELANVCPDKPVITYNIVSSYSYYVMYRPEASEWQQPMKRSRQSQHGEASHDLKETTEALRFLCAHFRAQNAKITIYGNPLIISVLYPLDYMCTCKCNQVDMVKQLTEGKDQ